MLVRTSSCESDCSFLYLVNKGIAAVAPGVFANLTGLERLYIYGNPIACVPGVLDRVDIDSWTAVRHCLMECEIWKRFEDSFWDQATITSHRALRLLAANVGKDFPTTHEIREKVRDMYHNAEPY